MTLRERQGINLFHLYLENKGASTRNKSGRSKTFTSDFAFVGNDFNDNTSSDCNTLLLFPTANS